MATFMSNSMNINALIQQQTWGELRQHCAPINVLYFRSEGRALRRKTRNVVTLIWL
jgi:hypothetical protein